MVNRKNLVIAVLAVFCLAVLFISRTQGALPYDPWYDCNHDGKINLKDFYGTAIRFGTSGTPINPDLYPTTGNITVAGNEFNPESSDTSYGRNMLEIYPTANGVEATFYATAHLPNGSRITLLTAHFYDGDSLHDAKVTFGYVQKEILPIAYLNVSVQTSGSGAYQTVSAPCHVVVDNEHNTYFLEFDTVGGTLPNYGSLLWVELTYTY